MEEGAWQNCEVAHNRFRARPQAGTWYDLLFHRSAAWIGVDLDDRHINPCPPVRASRNP